jgi:hypothetical protein
MGVNEMSNKNKFVKRLMKDNYDAIELKEIADDADEEFDQWENQFIRSQFEQSETYRSSRNKLAEESEY